MILAAVVATLVNLAYHYFTLYAVVGRFTLVYGGAASLLGIVVVRSAIAYAVRQHPYRFTVIGSHRSLTSYEAPWLTLPAGRMDGMHVPGPVGGHFPGRGGACRRPPVQADVAEIVARPRGALRGKAIKVALLGLRANVPVVDDRTFYGRVFERLPMDEVSKRWILEQGLARPRRWCWSPSGWWTSWPSAIGLVVLSPVLAIIALAVRLSGPGPVIFVQVRQGRFHQPFRMYKFRSMRADADAPPTGSRARATSVITRVGRVLRRTRLGRAPAARQRAPRRDVPGRTAPGDHRVRPPDARGPAPLRAALPRTPRPHRPRPAQAWLRDGQRDDTRVRLSYDLYYLCNYTLRMDLRIMLRTVLFLTRGAR